MTDAEIVERTIEFVRDTLKGAEAGHDWFHVQRVFKNTLLIAREEEVDLLTVSLGALLHDIGDSKFHHGDESVGPKRANHFLKSLKVPGDVRNHVVAIVENCSFKNSLEKPKKNPFNSKELQIVQDADKLDAIGAIGIARAFNYGGYKGRSLYDPEIPPDLKMTKEAYKKSKSPTINHFYEKLLLLKDQLHTASAQRIAEDRHQFMLDFLEQFYREWNGKP